MPWNTVWKRRRQPYGAWYGSSGGPVPVPVLGWGRRLTDRMLADRVTDRPFDQMLVDEYTPGQGISPHRDDAPFGCTVVSFSLLSRRVMDFRHAATGRKASLLKPRSLLVATCFQRNEDVGAARPSLLGFLYRPSSPAPHCG